MPAISPIRKSAEFYQTMQERSNAVSTTLLFFTLELNRLSETELEGESSPTRRLARYRRGCATPGPSARTN